MPSADEWWASLAYERREQIYHWVEQIPKGGWGRAHPPTKGQQPLFDTEEVEP